MDIHPSHILPRIKIPCGATAAFDYDSGISYRCENCFAVVGSIGQPQQCKDEAEKYELMKKLGGRGWVPEDNIVED
jgi:hypothetical protein